MTKVKLTVHEGTASPKEGPDNFDIFEDRVISLLERWKQFKDERKGQIPEVEKLAIIECIREITDDYTKALVLPEGVTVIVID